MRTAMQQTPEGRQRLERDDRRVTQEISTRIQEQDEAPACRICYQVQAAGPLPESVFDGCRHCHIRVKEHEHARSGRRSHPRWIYAYSDDEDYFGFRYYTCVSDGDEDTDAGKMFTHALTL